MLLGGIILVAGVAGYVSSSNAIAQYQTALGQIAAGTNIEVRNNYQTWLNVEILSAIGGVVGIGLLIYGAAARDPLDQRQWRRY